MKSHIFPASLAAALLIGPAVLLLYALSVSGAEEPQDAVAVNEAVKSVQQDWGSLEGHVNRTALEYAVIGADGGMLYRTRPGLSESIHAAVSHRDTILDIESGGETVGRIIIYNPGPQDSRSGSRAALLACAGALLLQGALCAGYFLYVRHAVIRPFNKMKGFAERVAGGNLDIPLEMDRHNLFGAFTESFDLMRSELKKARIAEAKASTDKKELVAKLSHDIRTPVASIKAAAEVGAALAPEGKSRDGYLGIIRKADQISTLVSDLFSATLEELRELTVTPSYMKSTELRALLENADYLHRAAIPPVPELTLFADRLRLQQVLDNIFANSYKYACTEIDVYVSAGEGFLSVTVEDHGGGVPVAELPLIKEKFKRGSNAGGVEGAGLGLYISDYCMREMQGRLDIENSADGLRAVVRIALGNAI